LDFRQGGRVLPAILIAATTVCCAAAEAPKRVSPGYDTFSGRLIQLSADQDGDGRVDQWTYLDGTRPLRGEKDADSDGRIDRWEYFNAKGDLLMVGTSSRNDGIEDTWTWVAPIDGAGRVDIATARDRRIDRHEFYVNGAMVRAELDRFGGREVKTIGDAFLVAFDGPPSRAVRCAKSLVEGLEPLGLTVRIGLHTGECEVLADDVGGMAVHIAARVAGLADPGEVLASGTV